MYSSNSESMRAFWVVIWEFSRSINSFTDFAWVCVGDFDKGKGGDIGWIGIIFFFFGLIFLSFKKKKLNFLFVYFHVINRFFFFSPIFNFLLLFRESLIYCFKKNYFLISLQISHLLIKPESILQKQNCTNFSKSGCLDINLPSSSL